MTSLVSTADLDAMTAELDLRDQVQLVRHHNAQVRRLAKRLLTEKVYNRTTSDALERRRRLVAATEMRLARSGHRALAGLLAEERQLRMRINPKSPRPELVHRLRTVEARIRIIVTEQS